MLPTQAPVNVWKISLALLVGVSPVLFVAACGELPGERVVFERDPTGVGADPLGAIVASLGLAVGDNCSSEKCRPGLVCNAKNRCEPGGQKVEGDSCVIGEECGSGLNCTMGACPILGLETCPICQDAGDGSEGDPCLGDLECSAGLRCGLNGLSAECIQAGSTDLGGTCALQSDCYQGLYCNDSECALRPPEWSGVDCAPSNDDDVEALFLVPGARSTADNATFFTLPYPSNVRLGESGRPNLEGFPTPGSAVLGTDLVKSYVQAIESDTRGWSTNPTAIFRFTGGIDFLSLGAPVGTTAHIVIADVANLPEDPDGQVSVLGYEYTSGGGSKYVCDNWLALRAAGGTLEPNHTYVVWLTTDTLSVKGVPIRRSSQFAAMLEANAPNDDQALALAYDTFSPLRDYLDYFKGSSNEIDPDTLLVATVFTTDDVLQPMRQLEQAVAKSDIPTASNWVKCATGVDSPCAQANEEEGRACGRGTADYDEFQALLEIPIFQKGTPPYLEKGGAIQNRTVRREKVCMSMSIPLGEMPIDGWPFVIYGHGTGGSYRGALRESVAGRLARTTPKFATITYDEVQHGPRRGEGEDAKKDPDSLFFNFLNPDAARGNPLQGAADLLSVLRFLKSGQLGTSAETGQAAIEVDPAKVFVFGHSQGSTHASMALPFSDLLGGILSGNGGGLADSLMDKTNPTNIAGAIPFAIQDPDSEGKLIMREKHPVMGLLQHYIDPADPINFAPLLILRPEDDRGPKSVLQTFGLDDTFAPPSTLAGFVRSAGLVLAPPPRGLNPTGENDLKYLEQPAPVSGNVTLNADTVTSVCRQYDGGAQDGHFVVHDVQEATADAIGFLSSLGRGELPTVPLQ